MFSLVFKIIFWCFFFYCNKASKQMKLLSGRITLLRTLLYRLQVQYRQCSLGDYWIKKTHIFYATVIKSIVWSVWSVYIETITTINNYLLCVYGTYLYLSLFNQNVHTTNINFIYLQQSVSSLVVAVVETSPHNNCGIFTSCLSLCEMVAYFDSILLSVLGNLLRSWPWTRLKTCS